MIMRDGRGYASARAYFLGRPLPECTLPPGTQTAIAAAVLELQSLLDVCANDAPSLGDRPSERFAAVVERIEAIEATLLSDHECRLALRWQWMASERLRKEKMGTL